MTEYKLSMWIGPDPRIIMIDKINQVASMGIQPNVDKETIESHIASVRPFQERVAVLIQIDGDKFKCAFSHKDTSDRHNHILENALLRYRLKHHPFTDEMINPKFVKDSLFDAIRDEKKRHALKISDASYNALSTVFCEVARNLPDEINHYREGDYLNAILEHNLNNKKKISVPSFLKREYRKALEEAEKKVVCAKKSHKPTNVFILKK